MPAENSGEFRDRVESASAAERAEMEDLWRGIAEGVSAATGEKFFRSLVAHLSRALKADCVSTTNSGHQRPISDENTRRKYQIQKGRVPGTLTLLKLLPQ